MIRTVIVDDDKDSRELIKSIILQSFKDEVEIVASIGSVKEAVKAINTYKPDLVLLDIVIPDESGLRLFDYFSEEIEFKVVFITAHPKYALQGYKYNALNYILKPIDSHQLSETIQRFKKKTIEHSKIRIDTFFNNLYNEVEINRKVIFPTKNGYQIIKVNNILFCKAEVSYSSIYTIDNSSFIISTTLKNLEKTLPEFFFRSHKSFLVNLNYIKYYNKSENKIYLENGIAVDIASRRVDQFILRLNNGKG